MSTGKHKKQKQKKRGKTMKTTKYLISFESCEHSMCRDVEISKKEYESQLKFMHKQVENTFIDEDAPVREMTIRTYENKATIETHTSFNCGFAYTDLIKIECKEGYHFKTKKEQK